MMGAITRTMQRIKALIALVTIAVAAAYSPAPAEKPLRADKAGLEAKAVAACECEIARGKGQSPDCWTGYKAAIEPFRPRDEDEIAGYATACAPVSTEVDCLKDVDGEFCITTGYSVNGVKLDEPRLCREAEARAIDDAFSAVMKKAGPGGGWNQEEAQRAAKEALASVRAGEASKAPSTSSGCV